MASQAIPEPVSASRVIAAIGHREGIRRSRKAQKKLVFATVERAAYSDFGHTLHEMGWTILGVKDVGDGVEVTLCPGLW